LHITRLALENFRIYPELQIEFSQGLTIIVGPNASGKTSLLEAIHLLATTKSQRTHTDRQLVRYDAPHSRVQGRFVSCDSQAADISVFLPGESQPDNGAIAAGESTRITKEVKVDGIQIESVAQIIGRVAVVIFSSEDLSIVKGSPGHRRRFLNVAIAQLRPRYLDDVQRYRRALGQRNELLKSIRRGAPRSDLQPWNRQLIEAAAAIAGDRQEFLETLNEAANLVHADFTAHGETLVLSYDGDLAGLDDTDERSRRFEQLLSDGEQRDVDYGYTAVGPHRDDFSILVNGVSLRSYGSQGQQRTAALSLKLSQADVVTAWRGEPPLVLLDDCLSELDDRRSCRVLEMAECLGGLIITSPVLSDVLAARADADFFRVQDGRIERMASQAAAVQ